MSTSSLPKVVVTRVPLMGTGQSDWRGSDPVASDDPMKNAIELAAQGRYTGFRFARQTQVVIDGETLKGEVKPDPTVYRFGVELTPQNIYDNLRGKTQIEASRFLDTGGRCYIPRGESDLIALEANEVVLDVVAEAIRATFGKA